MSLNVGVKNRIMGMKYQDSLWSIWARESGSAAMLRSSEMISASSWSLLSDEDNLYFRGPAECRCWGGGK